MSHSKDANDWKYTAADVDGLTVGEAFLKFVIRDARVQALGEVVIAGDPGHRPVFEQGRFPSANAEYKWPIYIGTEELTRGFNRALITYLPQPGDLATTTWHGHTFVADVPTLVGDEKIIKQAAANPWFKVAIPPEISAACAAIIERLELWRGLLCRGELVATGTFEGTGATQEINKAEWIRRKISIDVRDSDLFEDDQAKPRWTGLTLQMVAPPPPNREASARVDVPGSSTITHLTEARRPRRLTATTAEALVREFIDKEKSEGRLPTAKRLEELRLQREYSGGREILRDALKKLHGAHRRGRPKNKSPK